MLCSVLATSRASIVVTNALVAREIFTASTVCESRGLMRLVVAYARMPAPPGMLRNESNEPGCFAWMN